MAGWSSGHSSWMKLFWFATGDMVFTQVKGPPTYLVRCGNQERFVHVRSLEEDRKPVFKFWFWGERRWLRERGWGVLGQEDVWCWCSSGITSRCFQYSRSWGLSWPRKHGEFASSQEDASISDGRCSRESDSPGPVPPPDPVRRYPSQERRSPQRLICELWTLTVLWNIEYCFLQLFFENLEAFFDSFYLCNPSYLFWEECNILGSIPPYFKGLLCTCALDIKIMASTWFVSWLLWSSNTTITNTATLAGFCKSLTT